MHEIGCSGLVHWDDLEGWVGEGGGGRGFRMGNTCTSMEDSSQCMAKPRSICGTWNSAHCYVAAQMGEEFGGEWIHVYVWQSPFAIHQKLSQYCGFF